MLKETLYVDSSTGEIKHRSIQRITPAFDDERGYLFWVRKSFAKSFSDVPFPQEMTDADVGRMARLSKCIWSNTNMLGYRGNKGVRPYDTDKIADVLGISVRQAQRFIRKMIRVGMMAQVTVKVEGVVETHYYINPIYFFSSNRIPLNLYLIFRRQLDKVLPEWVKKEFAEQKNKQTKAFTHREKEEINEATEGP